MKPSPAAPPRRDDMRSSRIPAWLVPSLIVLVLGASAMGLVMYARQEQAEVVSRLTFGVARTQGSVTEWERNELVRIARWAADPSVLTAGGAIPTPLAALAKNAPESDGIRAIAIFSAQGAMLASTAPRLLSDPMLGQRIAAIQRARTGTASAAGPIWPAATRDGSETGDWLLMTAAPVLDAEGRTAAVLAFFFDSDAPLRGVRVAVRPDTRAYAYLIDERGTILSTTEKAAQPGASARGPAAGDRSSSRVESPAARSASGVTARPYLGPNGRAVIGAWAPAAP